MANSISRWQTRMQVRAAIVQQRGQPVTHKHPEIIASAIAGAVNAPAEPFVVRVDGVGAGGEFANPPGGKRRAQPDGHFLAHAFGNDVRQDRRIPINPAGLSY